MATRSTQTDRNLDFNGMKDETSYKELSAYRGNHYTGHCNEDTGYNQKQMPNRKGNQGYSGRTAGPVTAKDGVNVDSGARKWMPSASENYVGNSDKIQERQMYNRLGNKK